MKQAIFIILALALAGCVSSMPGSIATSVSDYDGARQIVMEPAWLHDSTLKMGLYKTDAMPKDKVVLRVVIVGLVNIAKRNSLHINIDGGEIHLTASDLLAQYKTSDGGQNTSQRDYIIKKSLVRMMLDGERVVVKVDHGHKYTTGVFSKDGPTTARPAFRKFYEQTIAFDADRV